MPIPIIVGGVIAASSLYGTKKGYDTYQDKKTSKHWNNKAELIYNEASDELEQERISTDNNLEKFGKLKVITYRDTLGDFIEIFSKIKNVNFENNMNINETMSIDQSSILKIKDSVFEIQNLLGGGITSIGGGVATGFGAYSSVGILASASTGTTISSLSGIAAKNATLAWLGGGSLATGGGGMALGTIVLGGITVTPAFAICSKLISVKAEKEKFEAYANYDKAKVLVEEMENIKEEFKRINLRTEECLNTLKVLSNKFEDYLDRLENIADNSNNYSSYSEENKKIVLVTVSIAQTIKNICDVSLLDEDGVITRKSSRVLKRIKKFIKELEEI
ncbi:MAG: Unknown protein [uncultured Campylobacterales bacterium]|uniref:Uncharacterized protein n=1 Tax=uncultured Campylobacterales bacterium TaxID=352960 RepID=A0A6S6TLQ8_9BACT|nr:MAG: Unknown protein [uncultured Campylobacterales bacterium]